MNLDELIEEIEKVDLGERDKLDQKLYLILDLKKLDNLAKENLNNELPSVTNLKKYFEKFDEQVARNKTDPGQPDAEYFVNLEKTLDELLKSISHELDLSPSVKNSPEIQAIVKHVHTVEQSKKLKEYEDLLGSLETLTSKLQKAEEKAQSSTNAIEDNREKSYESLSDIKEALNLASVKEITEFANKRSDAAEEESLVYIASILFVVFGTVVWLLCANLEGAQRISVSSGAAVLVSILLRLLSKAIRSKNAYHEFRVKMLTANGLHNLHIKNQDRNGEAGIDEKHLTKIYETLLLNPIDSSHTKPIDFSKVINKEG